jgi:outer membrane PBP1 activator LpoA protein
MLSTRVEFSARRRQDVDVVFLLARNGAEARSLKPLLAFHYAGSLPIYATSSIYNGVASASDRDLDGINLVEMPWLLGSSPTIRAELAAGNTGTDTYARLNALGADAYLLQSRFRQLQAGPDALLRGNTGLLTLNRNLQVVRELPLATFDEGVIASQ